MTNNFVTVNVDVDVWLGEIDDEDLVAELELAEFLEDLVAELESRGFRVISPDEGFDDDLLDGDLDYDPEEGIGHA